MALASLPTMTADVSTSTARRSRSLTVPVGSGSFSRSRSRPNGQIAAIDNKTISGALFIARSDECRGAAAWRRLDARRRPIVDRREREARLQHVRVEPVALRFELLDGDSLQELLLPHERRVGRGAQAEHSGREPIDSRRERDKLL